MTMDDYQFREEVLGHLDRIGNALEVIALNTAPAKLLGGHLRVTDADGAQRYLLGVDPNAAANGFDEMAAQVAGLVRAGQRTRIPTEEERAARWAARAAEVGMPPDEAEVARQRAEAQLEAVLPDAAPRRRRVKDAPQA